jgi:hypothetical protein
MDNEQKLYDDNFATEGQLKILADHLAAMCCQADEDCPAEYRTRHFRNTMDAAYEYLEKIGYFKK